MDSIEQQPRRTRAVALNAYLLATCAWPANALHDAMRIVFTLRDDPEPGCFPYVRGLAYLSRVAAHLQAEDAKRSNLLYLGHG